MSGSHCKSVLNYCMWYPGEIKVLNWIELNWYVYWRHVWCWKAIPKSWSNLPAKELSKSCLGGFPLHEIQTGMKLSEFYKDLKVAYMRTRPTANEYIMEEELTAQMCKSLLPEAYAKCLSNLNIPIYSLVVKKSQKTSWHKSKFEWSHHSFGLTK